MRNDQQQDHNGFSHMLRDTTTLPHNPYNVDQFKTINYVTTHSVVRPTKSLDMRDRHVKQPEEIAQEFIQKIVSRLDELDGGQQDIFFNSFLDNLEMEIEDKTVYDEGREYAEDALSKCEAFDSDSDREEFLADMFASLKSLVEANAKETSEDSHD